MIGGKPYDSFHIGFRAGIDENHLVGGRQSDVRYNHLAETGNCWQKNTVITLLSRLVEKGLLKTNKIGRRNEYTSLVSRTDYQAAQTQTFLNKFYEGDARGLVSTLISGEMISAEEYEELRRFWAAGREDSGEK